MCIYFLKALNEPLPSPTKHRLERSGSIICQLIPSPFFFTHHSISYFFKNQNVSVLQKLIEFCMILNHLT